MINPVKRALIILGAAAVLIIVALYIPAVKNSKMDNFLKGGAVGAASVGVLMLIVAFAQRQKA